MKAVSEKLHSKPYSVRMNIFFIKVKYDDVHETPQGEKHYHPCETLDRLYLRTLHFVNSTNSERLVLLFAFQCWGKCLFTKFTQPHNAVLPPSQKESITSISIFCLFNFASKHEVTRYMSRRRMPQSFITLITWLW